MLSRRRLVTGGLLGALSPTGDAPAAQTRGASEQADRSTEEIVRALTAIKDELRGQRVCSSGLCGELEQIRLTQKAFLKGHQKFPDFIDVGIDVWERIHDWHIANRLPISIGRMGDGRYSMAVMLTTLVLRPDATNTFIGVGYDR